MKSRHTCRDADRSVGIQSLKLGYPKVNVAQLPKGIYFVVVNDGDVKFRRSFIKNNNMIKQNLDFSKNIYDGFYWHQYNPINTNLSVFTNPVRPIDKMLFTHDFCAEARIGQQTKSEIESSTNISLVEKPQFSIFPYIIGAEAEVINATNAEIQDIKIYDVLGRNVTEVFNIKYDDKSAKLKIQNSAQGKYVMQIKTESSVSNITFVVQY